MEEVHIAFALTIFVVVVLILSCASKKHRRYKNKGTYLSAEPNKYYSFPVSVEDKKDTWTIKEDPMELSQSGRGVKNRQLAKQYSDLRGATYDDYSSMAQYMSLEPEVFTSHEVYSKEMNRSTTGPSTMSERSDPNDVVPWVLRRPDYGVPLNSNIRVEPTEFRDQVNSRTQYLL